MEMINQLMQECSQLERALVEKMICGAAEYVQAVVVMEATRKNVSGRGTEQWKAEAESTDRARRVAHDSFISIVNIVNRICQNHQLPPVYQGGEARRAYGDFALELVSTFFTQRH